MLMSDSDQRYIGNDVNILEIEMGIFRDYSDLIKDIIKIPEKKTNIDRKEFASFEKKLLEFNSLIVLFFLWKNSSFVNQDALDVRHVTVYSLAILFSEDPQSVSKTNSWVRSVVIAAEYFDLLKIVKIQQNKNIIECTEKMNELMLKIINKRKTALNRLFDEIKEIDDRAEPFESA